MTTTLTVTPCPSWCTQGHRHVADARRQALLGEPSATIHAVPLSMLTFTDPDEPHRRCLDQEVEIHLTRYDTDGNIAEPSLMVGNLSTDSTISLEAAELLARNLLAAVALARSARTAAVTPLIVCVDCGHEFQPDSSPSLTLCWQCDERADEEPDR